MAAKNHKPNQKIMSQSPPNYMENVPVKISERYKPPPKVSLPQSVCQRLNAEQVPCLTLTYDFSLEKNVLRRIDEWKRMREVECDARHARMRKRESERLRIEEEQKTLLTAVSYPSTEELSSEDELEDAAGGASSSPAQEQGVNKIDGKTTKVAPAQVRYNHPQQCFDTILTPTIVPDSYNQGVCNNQIAKHMLSKINYSDFENDTSSPFDNVELKTINDLDILAQVLNVTQLHSSTSPVNNMNHANSLSLPVADAKEGLVANNANNTPQSQDVYSHNLETIENCNITTNEVLAGTGAASFCDSSVQNAYNVPPSNLRNANHFYTTYNPSAMQNTININGLAKPSDFYYYPQPLPQPIGYDNYIYSHTNYPIHLMQPNENSSSVMEATTATTAAKTVATTKNAVTFRDMEEAASNESEGAASASMKSKSKSVPDILRELNEEIRDSENRRTRNNSQCIEHHEKKAKAPVILASPKSASETFMKLSPSSQTLAKNISSMGFSLELVSRIAERVGNDDKKIVEHLIPLSELLDLGFDETRISDALLKFDNNKEKALDFLIS